MLRNNFERLESLLQESQEENNKIRSEYEAKLSDTNDKLRTTKAENEELREKVDVLFKLGRGYINKQGRKPVSEAMNDNPTTNVDEIETVAIEEVTIEEDGTEDLLAWTKNKLRGFKRSGPTSSAENNSKAKSDPKPYKPAADKSSNRVPSTPSEPVRTTTAQTGGQSTQNNAGDERTMYCHYFSNLGKCAFEERTGSTCRFVHGDAPMCQSGVACKRAKCMYKHPNMAGRRTSFLEQRSGFPKNMNPWMMNMMNPWWNANSSQMQMPNPWMMDMNRK